MPCPDGMHASGQSGGPRAFIKGWRSVATRTVPSGFSVSETRPRTLDPTMSGPRRRSYPRQRQETRRSRGEMRPGLSREKDPENPRGSRSPNFVVVVLPSVSCPPHLILDVINAPFWLFGIGGSRDGSKPGITKREKTQLGLGKMDQNSYPGIFGPNGDIRYWYFKQKQRSV